jgi:DNA-binding GntR family transcriptional regulator
MTVMEPIKRPQTLKDLAYAEIRQLLTVGSIKTSDIITANQFAGTLKVSRTPVREALLQLASEGFLVALDGRGFMIRQFSEKDVRDFFEVRRMVEVHVIKQLAESLQKADFDEMDEMLLIMRQRADEDDPSGFLETDKAFHMDLVHKYNNSLLITITEQIRTLIAILGQRALYTPGRIQRVLEEHAEIVEGFRRRNVQSASEAMIHHLNVTEREILKNMDFDSRF